MLRLSFTQQRPERFNAQRNKYSGTVCACRVTARSYHAQNHKRVYSVHWFENVFRTKFRKTLELDLCFQSLHQVESAWHVCLKKSDFLLVIKNTKHCRGSSTLFPIWHRGFSMLSIKIGRSERCCFALRIGLFGDPSCLMISWHCLRERVLLVKIFQDGIISCFVLDVDSVCVKMINKKPKENTTWINRGKS